MVVLDKTYTYEMIFGELRRLAETYPELLAWELIGESCDGRPIPMVHMGPEKRTLFCTAGIHGRESINPVILLKMIEEYAEAFAEGTVLDGIYDIRRIFRQCGISFIPLVNPDGYEIAMRGFSAIRDPRLRQAQRIRCIPWESWKYNARGVDINRNFPCRSYVRQPYGDRPASERETRALMEAFGRFPGVGYLDFHSRGRVIYYYRSAMPVWYNHRSYHLARRLQRITRYTLGEKEEEFLTFQSGGNSVHYFSETVGAPAITVETVAEEAAFPLDTGHQKDAYREVRCIPLEVLSLLAKKR